MLRPITPTPTSFSFAPPVLSANAAPLCPHLDDGGARPLPTPGWDHENSDSVGGPHDSVPHPDLGVGGARLFPRSFAPSEPAPPTAAGLPQMALAAFPGRRGLRSLDAFSRGRGIMHIVGGPKRFRDLASPTRAVAVTDCVQSPPVVVFLRRRHPAFACSPWQAASEMRCERPNELWGSSQPRARAARSRSTSTAGGRQPPTAKVPGTTDNLSSPPPSPVTPSRDAGATAAPQGLTANAAHNVLPSAGSGVARLADIPAAVAVDASHFAPSSRTAATSPSLATAPGTVHAPGVPA
jgi:hypothetical protein